jgi:hypothetical protein
MRDDFACMSLAPSPAGFASFVTLPGDFSFAADDFEPLSPLPDASPLAALSASLSAPPCADTLQPPETVTNANTPAIT